MLEDLVEHNLDRIGMTTQICAEERRDLVAFIPSPAMPSAPVTYAAMR